ncbi:cobalt-precorrin-6A reductase [Pseudomonas sp. RIT-PI-AD]|uniref:cobalt-precorrin-6A reductase n=1 Tax=Pseudomonas sp. RIT-PI-AD TaxID=3035294 RepID=UPI0021DA1677|nr:cobalt-precorrin-6A reductase [Pseudomonas sp. RIT-PI-AD]
MSRRILLLGGTGDALRLAHRLGPGHLYSLAGLGRVPDDLACEIRVGGFGGAEGLAGFLRQAGIDLLLDLTHPYAARISANAAQAAQVTGVPLWALRRPAWHAREGDDWRDIADWAELIDALDAFQRPFFTLGREPLAHLDGIPGHQYWTIRCLQGQPPGPRYRVLGDRGPFELDAERVLFQHGDFDVLISKNSGGASTEPKLQVARELGRPVLMLARPPLPLADRTFEDMESLWGALQA